MKTLKSILLASSILTVTLSANAQKTITIDPGHGGIELGYDKKEIKEKEINLDLSKLIYEKINKQKYKTYLTRENDSITNKNLIDFNKDKKVDIKDEILSRLKISKDNKSDYVISIHHNANKYKHVKGIEIYYPALFQENAAENQKLDICETPNCREYHKESYKLAKEFQNFLKIKGINSKIIGADLRFLIGNTKNYEKFNFKEKRLLIEFGYMTNPKEYKEITSENGIKKNAELLSEFFNLKENLPLEPKIAKIEN